MAQQQLIVDLKSSRETAKNALSDLYAKIAKSKDNIKSKSSSSYNGVHAICMAIKDNGEFHEIYADAIKKLVDNISDQHWNMFVELLRYILGEFYSKNLFKQSVSLAFLAKAERITTPADVKSLLKLYSRHLFHTHTHVSEDNNKEMFKYIAALLAKCKEIEFEDLIPEFQAHMLGFPTMVQSVIVKHMNKAAPMFDKFFVAIAALKITQAKLPESMITLMRFLVNLIHLDINDKNTVLSQNFLKACKENQSLKEDKYKHYAIQLIYYLDKLLLFPNALDFNNNFQEVIVKFSIFFDRPELVTESWFMDIIVTMARILDAFKGQKAFLQTMNEESYQKLFSLIEKLVKLAHGVNYESGMWNCCNSARKHIIFKLCMVELIMFEMIVESGYTKTELSSSVYMIFKHTIAVAEYFKCNTVKYEVATIMNALVRCAQNVKTKEHGEHLVKMLLLVTRAKAHHPENSVRTLTKCLMHIYKVISDSRGQAEACSLYIAYLMDTNADSELIRRYITMFYSLEPCSSILETLDESKFPLKPTDFSRRMLHSMESGVFCKMRDSNILALTSLLKSSETILDFVLIARQTPQINVTAKLDRKYTEIKDKPTLSPMEYLAFGHICKIRAVQQMDELKNLFNVPKLGDESLQKIFDPSKLKLMDVTREIQIMQLASEGVEAFAKFFEFASDHGMPEQDFFVDWEAIFDDLSMLARLFHFRGYVDYAYISWRLLLRIAKHLNDVLNQIRALSFICDECLFIELYDPEFKIEEEIKNCERGIYDCLINMEFLTPRKQNYVLTCLCYMAWYLAQKNCFTKSQLFLDLVLGKVDDLVDRTSKFELVRATHLAVSFRIKWKLQGGLSKSKAFSHVDKILDGIRAVAYFTSEDSLNFPILLFAVVNDITEFTTNRMCEPATVPYVQMVLKMALDAGSAYRVVQFLALWTHINLQSENLTKCQLKLDLIDVLFRNAQPSQSSQKTNKKAKQFLDVGPVEPYRIYGEEAVRKAVYVNPISPVRIKHKPPVVIRNLGEFLITHEPSCTCDKCSHTFLNWQLFKVGCLNARLLYLGEAYNESGEFYTKAVEWCAKAMHKQHTKFHFREYELTMLIQHINVLRRMGNFEAAVATSKASLEICDKFKDSLDDVYFINLSLQSMSTIAEMQTKPMKLKERSRRFLKFSPNEPISAQPNVVVAIRKGLLKKESPKTIREDIENIIYKNPGAKPAVPKSSAKDGVKSTRRRAKNSDKAVEEICKTVERIQLDADVPKMPTTSTRRGIGRTNLNTAVIIIDDDDDVSPPPTEKFPSRVPKSASKVENTPLTRGRTRRAAPATVAKSTDVEGRSKVLLRRRI